MDEQIRKPFLTILQKQQLAAWQTFSEQHQEIADEFSKAASPMHLEDFKRSLCLSDFILRSAQASPLPIIKAFHSEDVYQITTPDYTALLKERLAGCKTEDELHKELREFRRLHMTSIAFADMVLNISLTESLSRLSNLADSLIIGALGWLSDFCYQKWGTPVNDNGELMPMLVYGMGKLGGKELNFSSDIDLIFVYPESGETTGGPKLIDNHSFFTRLGQKLITALNQNTVDGFVYRVDMRLRPFGESGPLVLSFSAMEDYYQEQGRDWERYAMLKARLIGEGKYHDTLSSMLRPFVYRRYIDFSVIDSLRKMKMMIAQEVRRKNLTNNIKLGAGGIREVEFIVQVFQLIRGGRTKPLQQRSLLSVLPLLVEHEAISEHSKQVLETAYVFLRRVENIVQALDDKQTQTLPDDTLNQNRILHVLGDEVFPSWSSFLTYTKKLMAAVHQEFIALIGEESPNKQNEDSHWVTLWESDWSTEESYDWITKGQPHWQADKIWNLLSDFRLKANRRSIGHRGRQVLGKLIPQLLTQIAELKGNDVCLERTLWIFDKIVTRTAYIELLYENTGALKHLVKLCQASQWVAEHIAKYPIILDELIDPKLFNHPPSIDNYKPELRQHMLRIPEEDLEAQMDALRQFKQAQQLRIAAADIVGVLPITKVSDHLTALAEAIVGEVVNISWQQIAERFGQPSNLQADDKGFAVIGYGKMGGIELGYSSDLDLVFVHNTDLNDHTNGVKQISSGHFYIKLAQRIMHIFNTRMPNGILYELDMRLRPSGNSGVMVVSVPTFEEYQLNEAWTWEHQALVRARVIYGQHDISEQINSIRKNVLSQHRNNEELKKDVISMREKMRQHLDKSNEIEIDVKQGDGGLVDIEFLAQYLVLTYSKNTEEICQYSDNIRIFDALSHHGILTNEQRDILIATYCELRDFGHKTSLQHQSNCIEKDVFIGLTQQVKAIVGEYFN